MDCSQAVHHIVERIVGDWPCFQIALQHGMGGPNNKKKEAEMCKVLAEYLMNDDRVDPTDIEAYLEEILDEDFDTRIEDGTVLLLATLLVSLTKLCKNGSIQEALDQLPKTKPALPDAQPEPSQMVEDMVDISEVSDVADQVASMSTHNSSRRRANEADEDGWVTVGRTHQ